MSAAKPNTKDGRHGTRRWRRARDLNDATARTGSWVENQDSDAWMLGAVLSYPVTPSVSLMGKVGAAYMLTGINVKDGSALTVRGGGDG